MDYGERQRRLDRARLAIYAELLIGLMVMLLTGFRSADLAPWGSDPMIFVPPPLQLLILAVPVVSLLAWVWMLRLSRPRPEAGERSWRYRDTAA